MLSRPFLNMTSVKRELNRSILLKERKGKGMMMDENEMRKLLEKEQEQERYEKKTHSISLLTHYPFPTLDNSPEKMLHPLPSSFLLLCLLSL